jgi:hypothetical protein
MSYSACDLSGKVDDIIAEAMQRPFTVTQRNKLRPILTIEDCRLIGRADAPNADTLHSTPVLEDFKRDIELYAAEEENF